MAGNEDKKIQINIDSDDSSSGQDEEMKELRKKQKQMLQ